MKTVTLRQRLINYCRSGHPLMYLVGYEEQRAQMEVEAACREAGFKLYVWTATAGVTDVENKTQVGEDSDMLEVFSSLPDQSVLMAMDWHMEMENPSCHAVRQVKEALSAAKLRSRVLIPHGCKVVLPPELEKEAMILEFGLPDRDTVKLVFEGLAQSAGIELAGGVDELLDAGSGGTSIEVETWGAYSLAETGRLDPAIISREKAQTVKRDGLLEIVEAGVGISDMGGYEILKPWITRRRNAFTKEAREFGLSMPKGFLLVGIPGCGKSLAAKITAEILQRPLVKLDVGKLFGSLVGESERNMRRAIETAEAIAPCVLFTDEIEKGFSGVGSSSNSDGGTTARVFGSFLQWMNDKTSPVMVVATANDVGALPPELLRRGRFDEMWFVDLPTRSERRDIWKIHISKKNRNPEDFDLDDLSKETGGYSGSEIESLFGEGLYSAYEMKCEPDTEILKATIRNSTPLSETMKEKLSAMRKWSEGRCRKASKPDDEVSSAPMGGRRIKR